ncbi:hypothetical protein F5X99DRAFT_406852 [Biscogniauxia marginata]|nr:hypothetical protein F5X99DRAFT_406852 [Biscogniauxia marginata]
MANSPRGSRDLHLEDRQPRSSTGGQQTPEHSPTPHQPQPSGTQAPAYHSKYSRITEARGEPPGHGRFYTDEDVLRYAPPGLPRVVAEQVQYPNINLRRRFRHLNSEFISYRLMQLSCIEDAVDEINVKSCGGKDGRRLTSLPFDRDEFVARCRQSPDHMSTQRLPRSPKGDDAEGNDAKGNDDLSVQLENLMANAARISQEYHEALLWEHEVQKFSPVSRRAHETVFRMLQDRHNLEDEALAPWRAIDDIITLEPDLVYERFESLLYTSKSWVDVSPDPPPQEVPANHDPPPAPQKGLQYLCGGRLPFGAPDGDPRLELSAWPFRWAVKGLMGLISSALVLVPFGALYLGQMERVSSFVIVAVFGFIFGLVITIINPRMGFVTIGSTAYYAVLASILSNLS